MNDAKIQEYWIRFGEHGRITRNNTELNDDNVIEDKFYTYYADFKPDSSFRPMVPKEVYLEIEKKLAVALQALDEIRCDERDPQGIAINALDEIEGSAE
jgi:hypothetical protein